MGLLVLIEEPGGETTWGLLTMASVGGEEWQVRVEQVPRSARFCYRDVVAVEAIGATASSAGARRFLRVAERGGHQRSCQVRHQLREEAAITAWLEELERADWGTSDEAAGVVLLAPPAGLDAEAVLRGFAWVTTVEEPTGGAASV